MGCETIMDIDHLRALLSGERQEPIVVGAIHRSELVRLIGAPGRHAVLLSTATLVKQAERHPDIGFDDYCAMPNALRFGLALYLPEWPRQLTFCYEEHTGRRYRLFVKSTLRGDELYVTSLHRSSPRQTKALLARGRIIRKHA